jgi:hypothetical protein
MPLLHARRLAEEAVHLTDRVLPHLPVRQCVLSLPKRLRPFLHGSPEVASAVLAIFLRALRPTLLQASPGATSRSQIEAVSFPLRFGSGLNPHYHFHLLVVDGVLSESTVDEPERVHFHEAIELTPDH